MSRLTWILLAQFLGACVAACALDGPEACAGSRLASPCMPVSVGIDTSLADTDSFVGVLGGEAPGETFLATDTLIRSVTVWRVAVQTPYGGSLKLWITEVDSTGKPRTDRVIQEGPVISVPFGDGIHPIKMEFILDPPVALPRPGQYFVAAQDYCGGHWGLLINTHDAFPDGTLWRTGRSASTGCLLRTDPDQFVSDDLVFTIEFCDTSTPVRLTSWGQLKLKYR
jgi:hypothetical protein